MRVLLGVFSLGLLLAVPVPAQAQTSGWDGTNPFDCVLQQVGTGTDFPDPGADPFCVEFDKTHQNVTELGVVDFLAQEPARVAAASPKCFYYQHDHWRGSLAQDIPATETYAWDGSYFFDKARGLGGVYVENFRILGQSGDPRLLPGFPEEWKPYFGPGRGGVQSEGSVAQDPRCVDAAEKDPPQARPPGEGGTSERCRMPGGRVRRGAGGVRLGMRRMHVKRALGQPEREGLGYLTWCFVGGGHLVAAFPSDRDRARTKLVLVTTRHIDGARVRVGMGSGRAKARMRRERRFGRAAGSKVFAVKRKRDRVLVGFARGYVSFLAVTRPKLKRRVALRYVRRAP